MHTYNPFGFGESNLVLARPPGGQLVRPRIVLVPGIMGSRLVEAGPGRGLLWGDSSMLGWMPPPRLTQWTAAMSQGNGIDQPGNVQPDGFLRIRFPLRSLAQIAAIMTLSPAMLLALRAANLRDIDVNPYGEALDFFVARLGTANVLPFPYDWRLANEYNANRLKQAIDQRWGDSVNDPTRPITIVAHSMGGLISRYYIEQLGGRNSIRNLVTVGTPHDGSPEALRAPTNLPALASFLLPRDIVKNFLPLSVISPLALALPTLYQFVTTLLRSLQSMVLHFNSVYQLLPSQPFVLPDATTTTFEPAGVSYAILQRQACSNPAALRLLCTKSISDLRQLNLRLLNGARSTPANVNYYCVVSHNHPTTTSCRRQPTGELTALQPICGDGTVPAASAMLPPATNVTNRFVAASFEHSDLLRERSILEFAMNVAQGAGATPMTGLRDVPPTCTTMLPGRITAAA